MWLNSSWVALEFSFLSSCIEIVASSPLACKVSSYNEVSEF